MSKQKKNTVLASQTQNRMIGRGLAIVIVVIGFMFAALFDLPYAVGAGIAILGILIGAWYSATGGE